MPKKKTRPSRPGKRSTKKRTDVTVPHTLLVNVGLFVFGIIVVGVLGFLFYAAREYQKSEEDVVGFFVCNEEGTVCENSQHIHADIEMNVCGQDIVFEREKGRTDLQHTHKEKNYIHWHSVLRVDPQTRIPLDPKPLYLSSFLEQMDFTLPTTCPTNDSPVLEVLVNGTLSADGLESLWSDGDKISIQYN